MCVRFYFCADFMLCHSRLHPIPHHRRLPRASSKDVIEDPCAGLFQIYDATAYVTLFLVLDKFLFSSFRLQAIFFLSLAGSLCRLLFSFGSKAPYYKTTQDRIQQVSSHLASPDTDQLSNGLGWRHMAGRRARIMPAVHNMLYNSIYNIVI